LSDEIRKRVRIDDLHPGQWQVYDNRARFNVLECGRRFGKTKLGITLGCLTLFEGAPVAWFAPTYKYLPEVWREAVRTLKPLEPKISVQERRIELPGTGGIWDFWSLDQPDAGRGRKYKRGIIDEAGIIRDLEIAWTEAIRPTLTDLKGDAWFLGTPKGRNFFHRLFARGEANEPGWRSWRLPTTANPYMDPKEIEAARRDMPPAAFDQEFMGVPADDGGNPFGLDAIKRQTRKGLSSRKPTAIGGDLAKSADYTVVCGLDEYGECCLLERWQSDWAQTRRRLLDIIGDVPALLDSTGVGDPIVEDLHRDRWNIHGFKFTATSKQQLLEGLAAGIQRGEVGFPEGWLVNELEAFEYEYVRGGVRYSAPEGLHDDGVMALALARKQLVENQTGVELDTGFVRVAV